jgi:hypothetical protein
MAGVKLTNGDITIDFICREKRASNNSIGSSLVQQSVGLQVDASKVLY